jgi:4-hydroxybenzoate polyprenyltransferase
MIMKDTGSRKRARESGQGKEGYGPIRRFRAWCDLGRTQGISTSASIAIIGAMTSTAELDFWALGSSTALDLVDIMGFTIIALFAHTVPNCYIELGDLPLDRLIKESYSKPVVSGVLKEKQVMWYVRLGLVASWIACLIFFPGFLPMLFLALSALGVMWYGNGIGKRIPVSYDYSFSVAYGFLTLFGVYAVGTPTVYTWIFMGIVVTGGTAFAQWENGLKDVEADRSTGVKSFAVLTGVRAKKKLTWSHPFIVYGVAVKAVFLAFCFWAFFEIYRADEFWGSVYLIFLLTYGIGSQAFLMWRFVNLRTRLDIRKTILMDVPLSAMVGFSVVAGPHGAIPLLLLMVFLIGGYMLGSKLQYGTEFKFGRYDKGWESRLKHELG